MAGLRDFYESLCTSLSFNNLYIIRAADNIVRYHNRKKLRDIFFIV